MSGTFNTDWMPHRRRERMSGMELDDALGSGREQAAEYPEGPWPAVLAELDRRGAAIERVRELCADVMVEDVKGGLTNADSLWPSDVLAALDGAGG